MDDKTFYTLLVSVVLAIVGLMGSYVNDLRVAERKDRLERINSQLAERYRIAFPRSWLTSPPTDQSSRSGPRRTSRSIARRCYTPRKRFASMST